MTFPKITNKMWRRHGNPWSIWSRLLSAPIVYLPFWNRSWKQGVGVAAWYAVNPYLFPEPDNENSWGPRAIRGERRWMNERPRDVSLLVQSVGAVAMVAGMRSAYRRRLAPTLMSAAVVMGTNAWFLHRMAKTYGAEATEAQPE